MKKTNIATRILLLFIVVIASSVVIVTAASLFISKYYAEIQYEQLYEEIELRQDDNVSELETYLITNGFIIYQTEHDERISFPDEVADLKEFGDVKIKNVKVNVKENNVEVRMPKGEYVYIYLNPNFIGDILLVINVMLGIILTILIITYLLLFVMINRWIIRRFAFIKYYLKEITNLNFNVKLPVIRNDEIGEVINDITDLSQSIERHLTDKDSLLLALSHELKTPLAKISAITYMHEYNDPKYADNTVVSELVNKEINKLNQSVNTMVYAIDHEGASEVVKFDLDQVISEQIAEFDSILDKKNILVDLEATKFELYTNKQRLMIILSNVLSNAIKYSDDNAIINIYFLGSNLVIENSIAENPESSGTKVGNKINEYLAKTILIGIEHRVINDKYVTIMNLEEVK